MRFRQGVYQEERIEAIRRELERLVPAGGVALREIIGRMDLWYKNADSAFYAVRVYLVHEHIPGFRYERGGRVLRLEGDS